MKTIHYGVDFGPQEFTEEDLNGASATSDSALEKSLAYCIKLFASHTAMQALLDAETSAAARSGNGRQRESGAGKGGDAGRNNDGSCCAGGSSGNVHAGGGCHGNSKAEDLFSVGNFGSTLTEVINTALQSPGHAAVPHQLDQELFHVSILRLLLAICSSMDSVVLLERRFQLSTKLLALLARADDDGKCDDDDSDQSDGGSSAGNQLVLEPLRLLRTRLFLLVHAVGGPTERVLPPRSLSGDGADSSGDIGSSCSFREIAATAAAAAPVDGIVLFSQLPIPSTYVTSKPKPTAASTRSLRDQAVLAAALRSASAGTQNLSKGADRSDSKGKGTTLTGLQASILALCKCTSTTSLTATAVDGRAAGVGISGGGSTSGTSGRSVPLGASGAFASALAAGAHLKHAAMIAAGTTSLTRPLRLARAQTTTFGSEHDAIGTKLAAAYARAALHLTNEGPSRPSDGRSRNGSGKSVDDGCDTSMRFERDLSWAARALQRGIANAEESSFAAASGTPTPLSTPSTPQPLSSRFRAKDATFDWFAASAHMILHSRESTIVYLENMHQLPESCGLWYCSTSTNGPGHYHSLADSVEMHVGAKLPAVANAFQISGFSIAAVVVRWVRMV